MDSIDRVEDAENRLAKALAENSELLAENQRLRKLLDIKSRIPGVALGSEIRQPSVLDTKSTTYRHITRQTAYGFALGTHVLHDRLEAQQTKNHFPIG